eukprot:COSAG02_NODE_4748_length_5028_cov_2.319537_1_plen_132_part_00
MRIDRDRAMAWLRLLLLGLLSLLAALRGAMAGGVPATSAWCPRFHDIYQPKMYDPSAPIRLKDGTWHMYPDGCGGWCASPDFITPVLPHGLLPLLNLRWRRSLLLTRSVPLDPARPTAEAGRTHRLAQLHR